MRPPRSIREIGDLIQEAREDLRRAARSLEEVLAAPHAPAQLGELVMRLHVIRARLREVIEELRALDR